MQNTELYIFYKSSVVDSCIMALMQFMKNEKVININLLCDHRLMSKIMLMPNNI